MPTRKRIFKQSQRTTKSGVGFLKSPTPSSGRASFAIVERKLVEGKLVHTTLKSESLDAINIQFHKKIISFERARILAKEVLEQFFPKQAVLHNQANLSLLNQYWKREYDHRDLVDRVSARNRLTRAIEAIGHYSLLSATREELQSQVDKLKGNKQRSAVSALNQMLKFFSRDFTLRKVREEMREVRFITETELKRLLTFIKDEPLRLMHEVAFATGLRAGELFGLLPSHFKADSIYVTSQMDVNRVRREVKNRKPRDAFIIPQYKAKVLQWANIPIEERNAFRKRSIAKYTRQASKRALEREITFHDLRHSYAIYFISKGISLTQVSQFLGDTVKVTEKFYSGYVSTPESIQLVKSLLAARLDNSL